MIEDYMRAKRIGDRQVHRAISEGRYPYPVALDDILQNEAHGSEFPVGLIEVPVSMIAGTKTQGRQNAFSYGFMPILDPNSEFALKWANLFDSQAAEGIRDPIKVYEYMQRFYVQEGNKRVSVVRYLDMPLIMADVTRIMPKRTKEKSSRIYYEFLKFYDAAPIYELTFSEEGCYARLAELFGQSLDRRWPDDTVESVKSSFERFGRVYRRLGGDNLRKITAGDAYLIYLTIFGTKSLLEDTDAVIAKKLGRIWNEVLIETHRDSSIALVERPEQLEESGGILGVLKRAPAYSREKPFRAAFIYDKTPEVSSWIYGHELGRISLEHTFGGTVETSRFDNCASDEAIARAVEGAAADNASLVFTISPAQMEETLRCAIRYPDISFMNCSINLSHNAVRTYYGRMYEAKFLMGALAATVCRNHKIGYRADYPIYGTIANINAFAIGASMIDPEAKIYLTWKSKKDEDWRARFRSENISVFSGPNMIRPQDASREYGIYLEDAAGNVTNLAAPMWNWGHYYELIVKTFLDGTWGAKSIARKDTALNYWWGMSAGVIDVVMSKKLPYPTRKLVDTLKYAVMAEALNPFDGELHSQEGLVKTEHTPKLSNEEIITMDWLNDNVIGNIPAMDELKDNARETVSVAGVAETR